MDENDASDSQTEGEDISANRYCSPTSIKLIPYKCFYFLFFSAVGSLFPYLAIFYKQLWLSAQQTGILIGIRPLLQLVSSFVWGIIADKSGKSKWIFLVSLIAWLSSNFALSLVRHPLDLGPCRDNGTITILGNVLHINTTTVEKNNSLLDNNPSNVGTESNHSNKMNWKAFGRNHEGDKRLITAFTLKEKGFKNSRTGKNEIYKIMAAFQREKIERRFDELNAQGHYPWPLHVILNFKVADLTRMVYQENDGIFFPLLIITVVGNMVASPAIPFADTATLQVLGDERDFYGKQRQWGSLGWGISSFVMGSFVSTLQEKSNCNVPIHNDYMPCFYAFAILMITAIIPAAFFRFEDRQVSDGNVAERVSLLNLDCISFLVMILFSGCSWGLVQTFLLWHLQDLGGTQFLFSIITAIQCLSEVVCYHSAGYVIRILGHHRLLYVSLSFSSLRLVLYGVINSPWLVLPIELFHGVSTTLVWSLAVSFIGLRSGVATTTQGLLSGIHWGLGLGGGGILGGLLVTCIGSKNTFIAFGLISLFNLLMLGTARNLKCIHNHSEESLSLLGRSDNVNDELIPLE